MKTTMALKPLVFALAAVMAMAAQAGGNDHGNNGGHGHNPPPPKGPTLEELLQIGAGAGAAVLDVQNNGGNTVLNQGTQNNAGISGSLNGANGNIGANKNLPLLIRAFDRANSEARLVIAAFVGTARPAAYVVRP